MTIEQSPNIADRLISSANEAITIIPDNILRVYLLDWIKTLESMYLSKTGDPMQIFNIKIQTLRDNYHDPTSAAKNDGKPEVAHLKEAIHSIEKFTHYLRFKAPIGYNCKSLESLQTDYNLACQKLNKLQCKIHFLDGLRRHSPEHDHPLYGNMELEIVNTVGNNRFNDYSNATNQKVIYHKTLYLHQLIEICKGMLPEELLAIN